ncbi:MAG: MBL fold metallo-hydrolase, partial [Lachnospiraceae bacterium]|nr:MBL fold metallo-hydrolase [Lachnospiraceae bacterium]
MNILELHYSNTNTYLIRGDKGCLLFDTGWAGTFPAFCKSLGEAGAKLSDIKMVLISHYHPDHMGIAGEIAGKGPVLLACDIQKSFLHSSDHIFEKENRKDYVPIDDGRVRVISINESRNVLGEIGIDGEIIATPGHSDDSISLLLGSGELFVGDLNP